MLVGRGGEGPTGLWGSGTMRRATQREELCGPSGPLSLKACGVRPGSPQGWGWFSKACLCRAACPWEGRDWAHNLGQDLSVNILFRELLRAGCVLCPAHSLPSKVLEQHARLLIFFNQSDPLAERGLSLTPLSKSHHPRSLPSRVPVVAALPSPTAGYQVTPFGVLGAWALKRLPGRARAAACQGSLQVPSARVRRPAGKVRASAGPGRAPWRPGAG